MAKDLEDLLGKFVSVGKTERGTEIVEFYPKVRERKILGINFPVYSNFPRFVTSEIYDTDHYLRKYFPIGKKQVKNLLYRK